MSEDGDVHQQATGHYIAQANQGGIAIVGDHNVIHTSLPRRIPLHKPTRAQHFTNREKELAQLLKDLQPGRVITLCGPGGIGKTALAAEAIWQLAPGDSSPNRFPDGIIYHSFYNQPQADLALEAIARAFGEEPKPTPRDAAQRVLAGRKALLLLDGAEDADNLPLVREVATSCGVLITTRKRGDALAMRQDLDPLPVGEAVSLLRQWGGDQAADDQATAEICTLVGGLPLAVRLIGRYLAQIGEGATEYLVWLRQTPLEALDQGQRRVDSVPLLLERSVQQVNETARQILAVVGFLALSPFQSEVIAVTLELSKTEIRRALGELVNYGLLLPTGQHYKVSHPLIHTYARERIHPTNTVGERLVNYYTELAEQESQQGMEGYIHLDTERVHIMATLARCVEQKNWEPVRNLAWAISGNNGYLDKRGHWTDRVSAIQAGLIAARAVGEREEEERFLGNLGKVYRLLGQMDQAREVLEQALLISREIQNPKAECANLGSLGLVYRALGQVERAIDYHLQALTITEKTGDYEGLSINLSNLGTVYRDLGQVERAIECYQQALLISREIGNRHGEAINLANLGTAYRALGDVKQATNYNQQALLISREIGNRYGEAINLSNLGTLYRDLGQAEQAIEHYQQALEISRKISNRHGEALNLSNLGMAYRNLGHMERALENCQQALLISREIGNRRGEAINLSSLGTVYQDLRQVEQAIEYYQQALEISRKTKDRRGEGVDLANLGSAYRTLGEVQRATDYYEQALLIAREVGDRRGEAVYSWGLGLLFERSNPARAVTLMSIQVAYWQAIGHRDAEADAQRLAQIQARLAQRSPGQPES